MAGGEAAHPADTERLLRYWAEGAGAARMNWGIKGDYDRCLVELGRYVPERMLHGLCQNLHIRATGAPAGHAPGEGGK
jgi:hypothetical protein